MKKSLIAYGLAATMLLAGCGSAESPTQLETTAPPTTIAATTIPATTAAPETTAPEETVLVIGNFHFLLSDQMDSQLHDNGDYSITLQDSKAYLYIHATDTTELGLSPESWTTLQHDAITKGRDKYGPVSDEQNTSISFLNFTATGEQYLQKTEEGVALFHIDVSFCDTKYAYTMVFQCHGSDGHTAEYVDLFQEFLNKAEYYGDPIPETAPETVPETGPAGSIENPYRAGAYKVGSDLPAGEYLFLSNRNNSAYICASVDSNGNNIIENANFKHSYFLTVEDGQYLQVKRGVFITAEDHTVKLNDDGSFGEGMYRVGIDIPAGEYKLVSDQERGYYEILSSSAIPLDIVDNDNFESSAYVTVSDGQYLLITRCTATPA